MRVIALLLILVSSRAIAAEDNIVLLVINGRNSPTTSTRYLELFDYYELTDELKSNGRLDRWTKDSLAAYRDSESQHGLVYTLGADGAWKTTGFATLKSTESFELFVADRLKKLADRMPPEIAPEVTRSGSRRSIKTPKFAWNNGSGIISQKWEQHYRYLEPVMLSSSGLNSWDRLRQVPIRKMAELLKPARGKLVYLRFQPGEVPTSVKVAALRAIAREAAPGLQRRDAEGASEFADRKSVADTKFGFLRSLLLDIENLTASTEWPGDSKPYRASCKVEAKKGSNLHKFFQKLSSKTSQEIAVGSGNLGRFQLDTDIPPEVGTLLNWWLQEVIGGEDGVFMKSGPTRLGGRFDLTDGHVQCVAAYRAELTDRVTKFLGESRGLNPVFNSVAFAPTNYSVAVQQGGVSVGLSTGANLPPPIDLNLARSRSSSVASIEFDFAPLIEAKNTPEVSRLLKNIETAYTRSLYALSDFDLMRGAKQSDQKSLLEFAKPDGDWRVAAKLDMRGNTATLNLTVGSAAHNFFRLRQLAWKEKQ